MAPSLMLSAGADIDVTVGKSYGTSKCNSPKLRNVFVFYLPNQTGFTNGLVHSRDVTVESVDFWDKCCGVVNHITLHAAVLSRIIAICLKKSSGSRCRSVVHVLKIEGAKGFKSVVLLLTLVATGNGEISSFGLEL